MAGSPYTSGTREGLLADLNGPQREAVTHPAGPLLVVAGAGTGKTRVLTRRVAWLVRGGLPAGALLAVTFTNKAADVLVERLTALLPGARVRAGTFHSFAARLLRAHGTDIGIDPDYTVLDREDQRRLLRDLLGDLGPDAGRFKPAEVGSMISHLKNGGGGRVPIDLRDPDVSALFDSVHDAYRQRLRAGSLLDFDDLLLEGLRLIEEIEDVAARYRRLFAHVLVDEYQDTNVVQARLLRGLVGAERNLTVVGDPDQSIYRWRGATVRNILDFEEDWPGAKTVLLERNYRSTGTILDAAEHVIARNRDRHAKRLFTENEEGASIAEVRCRDADDEAERVADQLATWQAEGYALGDMAVFYRVNSLSRSLELALRVREMPYVVVAGVEFFQRREVKDLLAYARLVENPKDEAAFLRIVNTPRRGIGKGSLQKVRHAAIEREISLLEAARSTIPGVSGRARKGLKALIDLVDEARTRDRTPVAPLLEWLSHVSGYRAWLAEQDDALEVSRLENLGELVAYAHEFDHREEEGDLRMFLERTALVADQDALETGSGRVSLMSVHAAKGLEFECVVITGVEDELFPHARSVGEVGGEEEERRIFYVAMTRAKARLALTHAARRFDWRGDAVRHPSPYLADVPAALLARRDRSPGYGYVLDGGPSQSGGLGVGSAALAEAATTWASAGDTDGALAAGMHVRHPYFGDGWIADRQGSGAHVRVTVDFDEHGRKQLLLSHARLERIS